jgi:hypothetical protein
MKEEELGEEEELTGIMASAAEQLRACSEGGDLPKQCAVGEDEARRR